MLQNTENLNEGSTVSDYDFLWRTKLKIFDCENIFSLVVVGDEFEPQIIFENEIKVSEFLKSSIFFHQINFKIIFSCEVGFWAKYELSNLSQDE